MDWLTVAAIAAMSTSLSIVFHEGVHALTCLMLGGKVREFSGLHAECLSKGLWRRRVVAGSASIANILLGFLTLVLLRQAHAQPAEFQFFLWLFMLMNLLFGAGYWMASGVSNFGDWASVIAGWKPHWAWRTGMAVFGSIVFMGFVGVALGEFGQIIGGAGPEIYKRSRELALLSYATAPVVIILSGLFFPHGFNSMPVVSGLMATLGALSPLLWMMEWFQASFFHKLPGVPLIIQRDWNMVASATIVVVFYVVILNGPLGRALFSRMATKRETI